MIATQRDLLAHVEQEASDMLMLLDVPTARDELIAGLARIVAVLKQIAAGPANLGYELHIAITGIDHAHHWYTEGMRRYYEPEVTARRSALSSLTYVEDLSVRFQRKLGAL